MSAARFFKLTVAYDGTDFHGWQKQPGLRTVQGELERAACEMLGEEGVRVHGAGRTDAGVHARGQGASFAAVTALPPRGVKALMQRSLGRDVRIVAADEMGEGFHARHSARARRYAYRLLDDHDVLHARYAWAVPFPVNGERLARSVAPLLGEHDFSAFETVGSSPSNPVCTVSLVRWVRWEAGWRFDVRADHFLYHMVRNLVGTSLRAMRDADPAARMADVLASRSRARAFAPAPAHGLCLESVHYEGEEQVA